MKKKKISAIFIGKNGSLGYVKNQRYELVVGSPFKNLSSIEIRDENRGVESVCEYSSFFTFLDNWENIFRN